MFIEAITITLTLLDARYDFSQEDRPPFPASEGFACGTQAALDAVRLGLSVSHHMIHIHGVGTF